MKTNTTKGEDPKLFGVRLKLVKAGNNKEEHEPDWGKRMLHGTRVLLYLPSPWDNTQTVLCANSYFASVEAAQELMRNGLRFIGVVKTATRRFPKAYLSNLELTQRGDYTGLVPMEVNGTPMCACVWNGRDHLRTFGSTFLMPCFGF